MKKSLTPNHYDLYNILKSGKKDSSLLMAYLGLSNKAQLRDLVSVINRFAPLKMGYIRGDKANGGYYLAQDEAQLEREYKAVQRKLIIEAQKLSRMRKMMNVSDQVRFNFTNQDLEFMNILKGGNDMRFKKEKLQDLQIAMIKNLKGKPSLRNLSRNLDGYGYDWVRKVFTYGNQCSSAFANQVCYLLGIKLEEYFEEVK